MKPRNFRIISVNKEKKSCSCIKWWKTPKKKKFKRKLIDIAHTKNSCDVELNWVKSLVMIRITRGLKNTKILAQKHINWLWFYLMKKELKKNPSKLAKKNKEFNIRGWIKFLNFYRIHLPSPFSSSLDIRLSWPQALNQLPKNVVDPGWGIP